LAFQRVADANALDDGELMSVEIDDGVQLCLGVVEGKWFATQHSCTHAEYPLSDGSLDGCLVECMLHGAVFDLRDGSVMEGPAVNPLTTYEVKIEDGGVWVEA
jgi:3-phenylpropionate/trans-cinnamate dioxygenase ferredoxin subunit